MPVKEAGIRNVMGFNRGEWSGFTCAKQSHKRWKFSYSCKFTSIYTLGFTYLVFTYGKHNRATVWKACVCRKFKCDSTLLLAFAASRAKQNPKALAREVPPATQAVGARHNSSNEDFVGGTMCKENYPPIESVENLSINRRWHS